MKYKFLLSFIMVTVFPALLSSCAALKIPADYQYQEIATDTYTLAAWQKITHKKEPIRIYVEGDGYAFDARGKATNDPTPQSTIVRRLAFNDPNPNVVYMARPCQYIQTELCTKTSWSTGRFSHNAVLALYEASKKIAQNHEIIFIGYSGGALLSGLVIAEFPDLKVRKWITIAGLLNHKAWTDYLKLNPLIHSLNLETLPDIPQSHYLGEDDKVIPLELMKKLTQEKNLHVVPNATHHKGLEQIFERIYLEN